MFNDIDDYNQLSTDTENIKNNRDTFIMMNKMAKLLGTSLAKLETVDELLNNKLGNMNQLPNYGFQPIVIDIGGLAFTPVKDKNGVLMANSYFHENGNIITEYVLQNLTNYKAVIAFYTAAVTVNSVTTPASTTIIVTNLNQFCNSVNYVDIVRYKLPAVIHPLPVDANGVIHTVTDFGVFGNNFSNIIDFIINSNIDTTNAPPVVPLLSTFQFVIGATEIETSVLTLPTNMDVTKSFDIYWVGRAMFLGTDYTYTAGATTITISGTVVANEEWTIRYIPLASQ